MKSELNSITAPFNIFPLNIQFWASYYRNIMQFHVDLNVHTAMLIIPERSIISLS